MLGSRPSKLSDGNLGNHGPENRWALSLGNPALCRCATKRKVSIQVYTRRLQASPCPWCTDNPYLGTAGTTGPDCTEATRTSFDFKNWSLRSLAVSKSTTRKNEPSTQTLLSRLPTKNQLITMFQIFGVDVLTRRSTGSPRGWRGLHTTLRTRHTPDDIADVVSNKQSTTLVNRHANRSAIRLTLRTDKPA